jgi:hypothetical protein
MEENKTWKHTAEQERTRCLQAERREGRTERDKGVRTTVRPTTLC